MKSREIFDALTNISDEYIEEARITGLKKQGLSLKKCLALAACLVLVIGIGGSSFLKKIFPIGGSSDNTGGSGSGHNGDSSFMSYEGPLLPLKFQEKDEDIIVSRYIYYDFTLSHEDDLGLWGSQVKDSYRLENKTDEKKSIRAIYPFIANLDRLDKLTPSISIDNVEVRSNLYPGGYATGFVGYDIDDSSKSVNIENLDSWQAYKNLLENGRYEKNAFMPYPNLKEDVKVYKFTDLKAPKEYEAATQAISFKIDPDKTQLLTYGFNGIDYGDHGFRQFSFFIPNEWGAESQNKYLIVLGDDIKEYQVQGYKNGSTIETNKLEGVSSLITEEETSLDIIVEEILDNYLDSYGDEESYQPPRHIFLNLLFEAMVEYGLDSPRKVERYDFGVMEDLINDVRSVKRVLFMEFELELPAAGSVNILANMHKYPSFDFYTSNPENQGIESYDMVTSLGSNLNFESLTAELTNSDNIEIINQNFGFDLTKEINRVELDTNKEHYFLEVRPLDLDL